MNAKKQKQWGLQAHQFYAQYQEQPVTIALLDGKGLTGRLIGADTYDLALRVNGKPVLVNKGAIKYVRPRNNTNSTEKSDS